MELANDTVLITGSSGGIGEEFAHQLAQRRANLVLVARRLDKLEELRATLLARHPDIEVDVIAADLALPGSGAKLAEQVGDRRIDVLINNAGVGLHGDFVDQDPERNAAQIQLNCGTLVDLTARFLPAMVRARHGVIINVASTAAFQPTPSMSVYGATKAFVQGYNAQIAVDSASQVIVAAEVTQETNDKRQLIPMIAQIVANLEQMPEKISADTGYFSEANVTNESVKDVDLYVATGREKHSGTPEPIGDPPPAGAGPKEAMHHKLRTADGREVYKMRKAIVEPIFGQIKEQRGFRRFSLRGKQNVRREWRLVCAASNLLKLFRAGWVLEMA